MNPTRPCPVHCPIDPEQIAIDPHLTYRELDHRIACAETGLRSAGIQNGDAIALLAKSDWQTIALLFAAWRQSISVALFSHRLPPLLLQQLLSSLNPRLIIHDPLPFFASPPHSHGELDLSYIALYLLTSGSSGTPKWAAFTLGALLESAHTVATALQAKPKDRSLLSLPLSHVGGLGVLLRALCSGGCVAFDLASLSTVQFASLIPTQLYRLLNENRPAPQAQLLIGGAPLAESLYQRATLQGYRLLLAYGLTEMSSTVLLSSQPVWKNHLPYLGSPLPGRELRLSPQQELLVRGASLFSGYGIPPVPPTPWFQTRDLGDFDEELGFCIAGRLDAQFISGGENIQPEEIELALLSHPAVEQAIVIPQANEEFGFRPVAFVKTALSPDTLRAYLKERIPSFKIPVAFHPFPEHAGLKPNRSFFESSM